MMRLNLKKPRCFPMVPETGKWAKYDKLLSGKKARTVAPRSGSPDPTLRASWAKSLVPLARNPRALLEKSATQWKPIPSMSPERLRTAASTLLSAQPPPSALAQLVSKGDPDSGLRVTILTTDTVRPGPSGAQATRTVQARDATGSFGVVSVDTTKSDNLHAIQVQIAPSEKPK